MISIPGGGGDRVAEAKPARTRRRLSLAVLAALLAVGLLPVKATPAAASHEADWQVETLEGETRPRLPSLTLSSRFEHCEVEIIANYPTENSPAWEVWNRDPYGGDDLSLEHAKATFEVKDAEGDTCTIEYYEVRVIEVDHLGLNEKRHDYKLRITVTHREKFVGRSGEGTGNTPSANLTVLPVTRTWNCVVSGGCPPDASLVRGVNPCAPEAYEITRHDGPDQSANINRPPDRDGVSEPPSVVHHAIRTVWREWHFDQCTIRVEQRQRYDSTFLSWQNLEATASHRFRPRGDVRADCSPSFYERYPHLCTSIYDADSRRTTYLYWDPDTRQYVPYDGRLPAQQKCNDCDDPGGGDSPGGDDPPGDDPPGDDPPGGDDNGGGVGGSVGEPLQLPIPEPEHRETPAQKGDRLIENMKRYDESCKVDPALVCGDYPFHEWVS